MTVENKVCLQGKAIIKMGRGLAGSSRDMDIVLHVRKHVAADLIQLLILGVVVWIYSKIEIP